jgi:hypothetical protein
MEEIPIEAAERLRRDASWAALSSVMDRDWVDLSNIAVQQFLQLAS